MVYKDREEAGKELAKKVASMDIKDPVVFALPRGGVPLGFQVAQALNAPLDTVISRKLGAPENPEFGFGAIAAGDIVVLNPRIIDSLGITEREVQSALLHERTELDRRMEHYRSGKFLRGYGYRTALIVDDGLATGVTAVAAARSVRLLYKPERIIFASPVCSPEALTAIKSAADDVWCLGIPEYFLTVGQWYERFNQISDDEVLYLLHTADDARVLRDKNSKSSKRLKNA
jgi:putative phosphoribosyl transferase